MSEYLIELKNVTKRFPGVLALDNMSIQIKPGEIHGLIGENGAGKSTLIKYLTGVHNADAGEMILEGKKMDFRNPNEARDAGIACVYQELNIAKQLSITDNIFSGKHIKRSIGLLDYAEMHKQAAESMKALGQEVDVQKPAGNFGMGIQQMIEIAKAIQFNAKLIIMDEPTSSLGEKEVDQLMKSVRKLKNEGIAILFVSHKLEELFELCDRVTVMRDGQYILTDNIDDLDNDKLITAMVGRNLDNLFPKEFGIKGNIGLEVKNLCSVGVLKDVSFKAYNGQVLGVAGLVGAGRTETFRAVFGADPKDSGEIHVQGEKTEIKTPGDAIRNKIAFLTEDRKGQGLVLSQDIKNNMIMANMRAFRTGPFMNEDKIENVSEGNVTTLQIKTPSIDVATVQLSGGNQQKVVIGKWLNTDADIFIFDEPTRGIDVGAKIEVYKVINQLVKEGKCVIMISSELPEILGMSDRVIVMRDGAITAEIERDSEHFNQEDIMRAAWGGTLS